MIEEWFEVKFLHLLSGTSGPIGAAIFPEPSVEPEAFSFLFLAPHTSLLFSFLSECSTSRDGATPYFCDSLNVNVMLSELRLRPDTHGAKWSYKYGTVPICRVHGEVTCAIRSTLWNISN